MRKASLNIRKSHFKHSKKSFLISQRIKRILPKIESDIWALVARLMGSGCPAQGLSMPTWWATDARVTGTSRLTEGHKSPRCVTHQGLKEFI